MALSLQTVPLAVVLVSLHLAAVFKVVTHSSGADRHDPWQRAGSNSIVVMFMAQVAVDVAALVLVCWLAYAWVDFMRSPVWPAQLAAARILYEQRTAFTWHERVVPWDVIILGYLCLQLLLLLVSRLWLITSTADGGFVCVHWSMLAQAVGVVLSGEAAYLQVRGGDMHARTNYHPPSTAVAEGPVGPADFDASPLVLSVSSSHDQSMQ